MADVAEVSVSYERKVQLDQYEPITHRVELVVALDGDDDADEVYDEYADKAEDMAERAIARRLQQKKLADEDD